jgi:hypothetical protein
VTATREAFTLPGIFLTAVLGGALEIGPALHFVPPPLFALVLGIMLMAALVQCGALEPGLLVSPRRSGLENVNGVIVLLTLFAASAQAMAVILPASGVPAVLMGILLFALLAQALAIGADRDHMMRGLLVSLALAYVLKFIVLASLSSQATSFVGRVAQLLFEGATLGSVSQAPLSPAAGYLAFATLLLYLFGLILLPGRRTLAEPTDSLTRFPHGVPSRGSRGSDT